MIAPETFQIPNQLYQSFMVFGSVAGELALNVVVYLMELVLLVDYELVEAGDVGLGDEVIYG